MTQSHEDPGNASTQPTPPSASEAEPASTPEPRESANAEPASAEAHVAPPSESHESTDAESAAEGEPEGQGEHVEGEAAGEGSPDGKKKRRRRRRKKKTEGEAAAGEEGAHREGGGHREPRRESIAPFARFFEGGASRRHAFSVGEVVAGRVARVEDGAVLVDLFGKALASVDVLEPREIPVIEETPEEKSGEVAAPDAITTPGETAAVQADGEAPAAVVAEAETAPHSAEAPSVDSQEQAVDPTTLTSSGALEAEADEEEDENAAAVGHELEGPPPEPPELGSVFRGRIGAISESGHIAILNRIIDRPAARGVIEKAREARTRVEGLVYGFNRGGFDVLVLGVRAFCPASGMSLDPIDDPREVVGRKLEFKVAPTKSGAQGLVVSRRSILERLSRKQAKERLKALQPGTRIVGRVLDVRDYGLLIDLGGGLDGLLHQSELGWGRGVRPADVAKPGDELEVEVLRVQIGDGKKDRRSKVSLSRRSLVPDPWDANKAELREGTPRKGRVVRTSDFGAFVSLFPGIDGLLHITELGRDLKHADQAVSVGEELDVIIERVDFKQRRISLSKLSALEAKQIADAPEGEAGGKAVRPGSIVKVIVEKTDAHGLHVQVKGVLGRRGRGYVPNRDLAARDDSKRMQFSPGTEIEVKVVGVDRDGGLRCSMKAKEIDEERRAVQDYRREVARQGLGTFGDLLRAKLGGGPPKS